MELVREDLFNLEAEGFAFLFASEVCLDDILLFLFGAESLHVEKARGREMALVELLAVGAGVAAAVHGDLARGEPFVPPPIVTGVFEASGLDFVPEPVFVKRSAKLIDDHLLQALEEVLGHFQNGALLGASEADIDHHGFGWQSDGEGDIDFMLTDEDGNALYESSFDGEDEDGTQITELDFNEETGEMDISDVAIEFDDFSFDGSDTTEPTTEDSVVDQPTDSVVEDTPVDEEPAEETEAP